MHVGLLPQKCRLPSRFCYLCRSKPSTDKGDCSAAFFHIGKVNLPLRRSSQTSRFIYFFAAS